MAQDDKYENLCRECLVQVIDIYTTNTDFSKRYRRRKRDML